MQHILSCLLLGLAAGAQQGVDVPPPGLNFTLHLFAPQSSLRTPYPTIFFVSGLSGKAPVESYSDLLLQIAGEGYVVVGLDHPAEGINYPRQGKEFLDVLEWASAGNLKTYMEEQGLAALPDLDHVAVMAQSAGNHVVGQGLVDGCSLAKALILIDPVDGFDPFGIITSENLITPGEKLAFNIPTLHLDNFLDPVAVLMGVSCSPADLSGPRWFDAMAGPVWNVNATKYGHIDCLNNGVASLAGFVCATDKSADNSLYKKMLASSVTTFLGALFFDRPDDLAKLEDASQFGVEVEVRQDLKGLTHDQIQPGCTNTGIVV